MLVAPCTAQATDTGTMSERFAPAWAHAMGNVEERPSLQRLKVYSSVWQRGLSMRSRCPQSSDHIASARPTVCDSHWACALPRCALHEHRARQRYHATAHRSWRALLSSSVRRALSTRQAPLGRVSCAERWCSCSGGTALKTGQESIAKPCVSKAILGALPVRPVRRCGMRRKLSLRRPLCTCVLQKAPHTGLLSDGGSVLLATLCNVVACEWSSPGP